MKQHLPTCPICQSETEYNISPSLHIVQCNVCKAKYLSLDLKDPEKDLNELMLFALPTGLTDKKNNINIKFIKESKVSHFLLAEFQNRITIARYINRR